MGSAGDNAAEPPANTTVYGCSHRSFYQVAGKNALEAGFAVKRTMGNVSGIINVQRYDAQGNATNDANWEFTRHGLLACPQGGITTRRTDPVNPALGTYLNTPEIRSGFISRGKNSVPEIKSEYGYVSLYSQEHVGSSFAGIVDCVGFDKSVEFYFYSDGYFSAPAETWIGNGSTKIGADGNISGQVWAAAGESNLWRYLHTTFASASDLTLKKGIGNSQEGALDCINAIQTKEFTWKRDERRDCGFIAQDLAKVDPLYAYENEAGVMCYSQNSLIADLIDSVKTLSKRVTELDPEI